MIPKIKFNDNREETCPASSAFSLLVWGDVILWRGVPDLKSGPTFSKARTGVWSLARTDSRRAVLPSRNPIRLFNVAVEALWIRNIIWNLAKHPTKEEGTVLQEDGMYQPYP